MDEVGNTRQDTGQDAGQTDAGRRPETGPGDESETARSCSLSVYRAAVDVKEAHAKASGPGTPTPAGTAAGTRPGASDTAADTAAGADGPAAFPDGFSGILALKDLESFDEQTVGNTLGRVSHLIAWAQAQQARLLQRMETLFQDRYVAFLENSDGTGRTDPGMAFSLAAAECAAILNVPQVTGQRLLFEAGRLCGAHTKTLQALEDGRLGYPHAQVVLDQCDSVPAADLPEFEADLLTAAEGQTRAQFSVRARRLREKKYPQSIPVRHQSAFEKRRVALDREEDGMSWLSVLMRAAEAQQIYTTLSTAARGEREEGDPRTTDQLRADILTQLLMGGLSSGSATASTGATVLTGDTSAVRPSGSKGSKGSNDAPSGRGSGNKPSDSTGTRAEIMVLINAETLFGADDQPAELHGYGPISAEEARRLARHAVHWTGLARDPHTGEILGVGRRRKVPAGLARWLRARDGTCRFPGCRVSTAVTEIDHTTDWSHGGATEHSNLAHLCRRHHRFKTLGYWKACQPAPGVMEWTSPTGRAYRTEPFLELAPAHTKPEGSAEPPPF